MVQHVSSHVQLITLHHRVNTKALRRAKVVLAACLASTTEASGSLHHTACVKYIWTRWLVFVLRCHARAVRANQTTISNSVLESQCAKGTESRYIWISNSTANAGRFKTGDSRVVIRSSDAQRADSRCKVDQESSVQKGWTSAKQDASKDVSEVRMKLRQYSKVELHQVHWLRKLPRTRSLDCTSHATMCLSH